MLRKHSDPKTPGKTRIRGRLNAHPKGHGVVTPDEGGLDVFLPQTQMHTAMHGDYVEVSHSRPTRYDNGRPHGHFHQVIARNRNTIVGRLVVERNERILVPEDPRILHCFDVNGSQPKVQHGALVSANITEFPQDWGHGKAQIHCVFDEDRPGIDTDCAIAAFNLPHTWPKSISDELEALDTLEDVANRKDLTDLPFVTIDGKDAKDFDDAVCAKVRKDGWTLWVAIADVSHYVRPDTALDVEARERGTSVYFPNRVLPMLPQKLSEDLCSLRPDVERKVVVCEMRLDSEAAVQSSRFYLATIQSRARLTYSAVNQALFENNLDTRKQRSDLWEHLEPLKGLYQRLYAKRRQRGALDFSDLECRFCFDANGQVTGLQPLKRLDAHRMIEEFMITANVAAARYLEKHRLCNLYRVHDQPQEEKLDTLRALVASLGFPFPADNPVRPSDCATLLEEIEGSHQQMVIERALLRAQSLSVYSPDNIGHFGLALDHYAHFTSPIRRYPDLCVHRAIRSALVQKQATTRPAKHEEVKTLGDHCSRMERRANEAVWDVEAALKCRLAQRHIGKSFSGIINTVTSFGLFVELDGLYTEGLLHIRNLGNDYYLYDPEAQALIGESSGVQWRLGQRIRVRIRDVDVRERKINLHPKKSHQNSTHHEFI